MSDNKIKYNSSEFWYFNKILLNEISQIKLKIDAKINYVSSLFHFFWIPDQIK